MNDTIVNIFIEMNDTTVKIIKKKFYSISILVFYSIFFFFLIVKPNKTFENKDAAFKSYLLE